MNISLQQADSANATLTVNLTETDYAQKLSEKIKNYSKKAQIKGFRPGKVPAALIQKMYGKSLLVEQVNELLSESVNNYLRDNKVRILGEPLPNRRESELNIDWDSQRDFEFSYDLGLVPDFTIDLGPGVSIEALKITVDPATLEQTFDHLRKQFGKSVNPDVAKEDDFLYGELKQLETDFQTKTLIPINKVKEGQEKFIGSKPGDLLFFDIRKTFGYDNDAIAHVTGLGKDLAAELQGEFEFVIEKINSTEPAEINQELFDKVFGPGQVNNEEEFRKRVEETVRENYQREAQNVLFSKTIQQLVNSTPIELPVEFLRRWMLLTNEGLTEEKLDEQMDDQLNALRWNLIKNEIADTNDLKVSGEEVLNAAKNKMIAQFGLQQVSPDMEETLSNYANQMLQQDNGKQFKQEYDNLLTEKVIQYIISKIQVKEKEITAEEFRNMSF